MTADNLTVNPPVTAKRGFGCVGWGIVLLLVLAAAVTAVWRWQYPATVPPPTLPEIQDAEIRRAIERAKKEVEDKPRSGDAWGHLAMTLLAHLFDQEADRCFAEAMRWSPKEALWPYGRGIIAGKRDPQNTVGFLRQAAALADNEPGGAGMRLQLAEALLDRGQRDEAETRFQDELRREPGNHRAEFGLGLIALAKDDSGAAVQHLNAARASPFARKKALVQLAALASAQGDGPTAARLQKEAAALADDPPWPDPLLDRILDFQVGRAHWERLAEQMQNEGHYEEAAKLYLDQVEQKPTARAYIGTGLNLARMHQYEQALPYLRKAVSLDPDSPNAHYTLALTLFARAEREIARSPDSAEAKAWFQEAIDQARRTVELKPDHAAAFLTWGLALKHLGHSGDGIAPLRRGVACRTEDMELNLALGEALLEAGQDGEAKFYLETAARLKPKDTRPLEALERLRRKKN